jgi:hypothetical protein
MCDADTELCTSNGVIYIIYLLFCGSLKVAERALQFFQGGVRSDALRNPLAWLSTIPLFEPG